MVKLIGVLLIVSSVLSLFVGIFIDLKYSSDVEITGNVISNIIKQPEVKLNFFNYLEAIALSYSIASFMMAMIFLFRF